MISTLRFKIRHGSDQLLTIVNRQTKALLEPGAGQQEVDSTVDREQILRHVINDKAIIICETRAMITIGTLPCVLANTTGMTQLFGNLIVNAIKYQREGVPSQITVNAHDSPFKIRVPLMQVSRKAA